MTQEQFKDIQERLAKWREERGLSVEDQQANFEVNYTKELVEYFEAYRDNNEYEMIDAVCDMIIVAMNAGHTLGLGEDFKWCEKYCRYNLDFTMPLYDEKALILLCRFLSDVGYDPYLCLLETIKELDSRTGSWNEEEGKWIKEDGCYSVEDGLRRLSKFYDVSLDTEIYPETDDSYTFVYWDYENDESVYVTMKKWYKADYSKCKND